MFLMPFDNLNALIGSWKLFGQITSRIQVNFDQSCYSLFYLLKYMVYLLNAYKCMKNLENVKNTCIITKKSEKVVILCMKQRKVKNKFLIFFAISK